MRLGLVLILLGLVLPLPVDGQGYASAPPGATGGGKVLASYPLTTSGPLIVEDSGTVAHVYWNGTALVDTKGNAWTENGTVPQVSANPFTTTRYGAGPFSAANYYSLGTGTDVLDLPGDMTVCVVFSGLLAGTSEIASDGGFGAAGAGWSLLASATQVIFDTYDAASAYTRASSAATVTSGPCVICAGRSGSTQYVKSNLVATVSQAGAKTVAATSNPAMIGRRATGAGTVPMEGTIYELYATSTPFTEATVVEIQQKVLGHFDGSSALAVTRATTATYSPRAADPSTLFTVPAGVARITDEGLLVEPARTNVVLASNTISAANAFNVNWVAWPDETTVDVTTSAVAAPGGGTWHTITNEAGGGSNVGQAYQTVTGASSAYWVGSVWMKKPTGEDTTHAALQVGCGAGAPVAGAANCLCYRSDGGACTASTVATNYCQGLVADLGTTPVRLTVGVRCSGAITQSIIALVPGNYGSTVGITDFSGAQAESSAVTQLYSTSLVPTTTTALARNADSITATVPSITSAKWCIAASASVSLGTTWADMGGSGSRIWSLGTQAAANTQMLTPNIFDGYDGAGTPVRKYWNFTASAATGTIPIRYIACSTGPAVYLDGVAATLTPGGTGVPTFTPTATTLAIGARTTGANAWSGFLKDIKLCDKATKAKDCK